MIEPVVLNDSETIHTTGISTRMIVTMFATLQPTLCGAVVAISVAPPFLG